MCMYIYIYTHINIMIIYILSYIYKLIYIYYTVYITRTYLYYISRQHFNIGYIIIIVNIPNIETRV